MIEPRLKKLDAIAGIPKTCFALSIPITSAASDTRRMKGNMMRVSKTVSSAFSMGKPGARMLMRTGAKMTPSSETALIKTSVRVATLLARFHADLSPSVAIRWEKVVTNAVESAPSAKRSRNILGARNAVRNASMFLLAPKSDAKTTSRRRPSTRLQRIARPTTPVARVLTRWFPAMSEKGTAGSGKRKPRERNVLQTGGMIDELPRNFEVVRQMRGERLGAKSLGRIM